eukprot:gene11590-biopygen9261
MQQLSGDNLLEKSIFKQLFLQRLPMNAQLILASTADRVPLDELAALADKILEAALPTHAIAALQSKPTVETPSSSSIHVGHLQLIDTTTSRVINGLQAGVESPRPVYALPAVSSPYRELLKKCPHISRPNYKNTDIKHRVTHQINTHGQPAFCRPRRLTPDRLKIAKAEFDHMLQLVQAIEDFPPPSSLRKVHEFLGLVNFYRRFIPNCASIIQPLTDLLSPRKTKETLQLSEEAITAFREIKSALTNATLLVHPSPPLSYCLMVDALNVAVGGVLQQRINNTWKPLGFFSKHLKPAEVKYSTVPLVASYLASISPSNTFGIDWKVENSTS